MKEYRRRSGAAILLMFALPVIICAQEVENVSQLRISASFSKKIWKPVKLSITPELRWDNFSDFDQYNINAELAYSPVKTLTLSAGYRFVGNVRDEKETEYLHRFAFDAKFEKKIERFKPQVRILYTNYTDEDDGNQYLRYKAAVEYNIRKSKFTPELGWEIYHALDLAVVYKYRFSLGADYKLDKKHSLFAAYKFDYYKTQYKNRHIIDMGIKFKL